MIGIDRLVLDIPGMNPTRAARLAERIGARLTGALPKGGKVDRVQITLPSGAPSDEAIIAAVTAAIAARID